MRQFRLLLLIENQAWGGILQLALAEHQVELHAHRELARDAARRRYFDLAVVDCGGDAASTLTLLREWRQDGESFPIIVLSDLPQSRLAIDLLEAGADDFLRKPYHHAELVVRMQKLLARRRSAGPDLVRRTAGVPLGSAAFAFGTALVTPDLTVQFPKGTSARLRPKQHGILKFLADRAGRIAVKEELVREVWGSDGNQLGHSVNEYISNLRRLFSENGLDFNLLVTSEPKVGWRVQAAVAVQLEPSVP